MSENVVKKLDVNLETKMKVYKKKHDYPLIVVSNQTLDLFSIMESYDNNPTHIIFRNCKFDNSISDSQINEYRDTDLKVVRPIFIFENCEFVNFKMSNISLQPTSELIGKNKFTNCIFKDFIIGKLKGVVELSNSFIDTFGSSNKITYDNFIIEEDSKLSSISKLSTENNMYLVDSTGLNFKLTNTKTGCRESRECLVDSIGKYVIYNRDVGYRKFKNFDIDNEEYFRGSIIEVNKYYDPEVKMPEPKLVRNMTIHSEVIFDEFYNFLFYLSPNIDYDRFVKDVISVKNVNDKYHMITVDLYPMRFNIQCKKIISSQDIAKILFVKGSPSIISTTKYKI